MHSPATPTLPLGFLVTFLYNGSMPTILRIGGLRFVVYPNDHPPAHVHVIGPGWTVVVNLHGQELRAVIGPCSQRDARRVLDLVAEHGTVLLEGWRRFHD